MQNKNNNKKINIFSQMEENVLEFWENNKIFKKSVKKKAPNGDYVFYDGPPFATGMPHYGHIVGTLMKDVVPRYWTMKGYRVERKWGWDCHGLPVENLAEKEMELKDKTDIEKIGVEKFNNYCSSIVMRYAKEWKKIIKRIGRWVDMENDYKTMDANYTESIWWVFKTLFDKGLIYQGHKAMHICPRCGTTLSNFEVTQNYKDIKDLSVIAKFELIDEPNTFVLAWTTTPWTLIGNVALAIGEDIEYVEMEIVNTKCADFKNGEKYIFSKNYFDEEFSIRVPEPIEKGNKSYDNFFLYILKSEKYKGTKIKVIVINHDRLFRKKYKPLFNYYFNDEKLENKKNGWKIYSADFVNTDDGTGIVHIAPAFGEDDMEMGKKYDLPFVQHVDENGRFKKEVKDFKELEVKPKDDHQKTDIEIIKYLAHNNLLFSKKKYEHSYPHCWRCDTPLLNYATESWFVSVTKIKKDLIKTNTEINWVPEHIKLGRFGKWLENAHDWAISRNRYWGAPLPVWICDKCGEKKVIGSREELKKISKQNLDDLHKQFVDKIELKCEKCNGKMKRVPEVLDCWFESGAMPYAQQHYPFENKEKFENNFPANFIAEGVDQTRGWFYTLHVLANALKINDKTNSAFKNVIVNGIVLAEDGKKMSKRLQNYPDPTTIFEKYSVDALRYYLLSSSILLAENINFSEDGVKEALRKVEMILWNVVKFYKMFANETDYNIQPKNDSNNILDKWILARLNQLINEVTENMDNYIIPKAVRPIEEFINDLSTWYIRRSRDRFKGDDEQDKKFALQTTKFILIELSKIMAPFLPFLAEQVWQEISGNDFKDKNKSVHLENWPKSDKVDKNILNIMKSARIATRLGLSARDLAGIKVRQPLKLMYIDINGLIFEDGNEIENEIHELIKDEVNIKELNKIADNSDKAINRERTGVIKVKLADGREEKHSTDKDGSNFVSLVIDLTPELKEEGTTREIIRSINNLRKQANMTIQDRAIIYWQTDDRDIENIINKNKKDILKSTLSNELIKNINNNIENIKSIKIDEKEIIIGVVKK